MYLCIYFIPIYLTYLYIYISNHILPYISIYLCRKRKREERFATPEEKAYAEKLAARAKRFATTPSVTATEPVTESEGVAAETI